MEEHISINAKIGSRSFKMKIKASNETFVRESLQKVADKLHQFKITFPGRDEQDYLAMTLIDFITTQDIGDMPVVDSSDINTRLNHISALLDQ